jgi:GTP pyrophosphokinase/guanosine-3',5'-bis(diphosphate) 3'-pyrophosphohydrolase
MGMNLIRDELEDLSFSVLNSQARNLIIERLKFIKDNRIDNFKIISEELVSLLIENGITATLAGREKTPFSIWRKIQNKKISLEHLTDIVGFRIIVNSTDDCYKALGILHISCDTTLFKFMHLNCSYLNLYSIFFWPNNRCVNGFIFINLWC